MTEPTDQVLATTTLPTETTETEIVPVVPAAVVPTNGAPIQTGYVPQQAFVPMVPIIQKQTYSSVMSYVGITRRTTAWARRVGANGGIAMGFAITAAVFFLLAMYCVVTVWYLVVGLLFGWLMFPFRFIRRSHRKSEALQKQQLATMQAMLIQQQQGRS
jgi:hypothetical protein